MLERVLPALIAFGALAVAAFLLLYHIGSPWDSLVHELAMALLVFAFLTLTFEGLTRKHITKHVERELAKLDTSFTKSIQAAVADVRQATAQKILSSLVGEMGYAALEPYLRRVSIWRPKAELTVTIRDVGGPDHFEVALDFVTEVRNEDENQAEYRLVVKEEEDYSGLGRFQDELIVLRWNRARQNGFAAERERGTVQVIKPVLLKGGEQGHAHIEWQVARRKRDHYDFSMWYVTGGLKLTVHHPGNVQVDVEGLGFAEIDIVPGQMAQSISRWEIQRPILPSQGITLRWSSRS